jgi:hypothetical protein
MRNRRRETALKDFEGIKMNKGKGKINKVSGQAAPEQDSEAGWRVCFSCPSLGVSQEEVQENTPHFRWLRARIAGRISTRRFRLAS